MKYSLKYILFILLIIMATMSTSCGHREAFDKFVQIKNGDWQNTDTIRFRADSLLLNSKNQYTVYLELTNNINYSFQDIWINISENVNDSSLFVSHSNVFKLADKSGKWLGAGFGSLYQIAYPIMKNISLSPNRYYIFKINHLMNYKTLTGIERVGLRFVEQ